MKYFLIVFYITQVFCQQDLVFVKDTEDEVEVKVDDVSETEITNDEVFVPTLEWQVIKPGQAIPPGLHVRLNMQTGVKEWGVYSSGTFDFFSTPHLKL